MNDNEQLSSLATHLYVRLRRDGGRVIDVIWLMRNAEYAKEILRIARGIPEPELEKLCARIEELMFSSGSGSGSRAAAARAAAAPAAATAETSPEVAAQITGRYRGGLR